MKIGVLGTGMVGETIGAKLVERGHEVKMGSRDAKNPKAAAWAKKAGAKASIGTFQDAAKFGEIVFNCTAGVGTLPALKSAGEKNLDGKLVVDISNGLDFSKGMPPSLIVDVSKDSLGEQIQRAFPKAKVVKAFNTITAPLMVNPAGLPGEHHLFISGDESGKKTFIQLIEKEFGWKKQNIIDLGDITGARAQEALIVPWVRLYGKFNSPMFNWQVVQAKPTR